MHTGTVSLIFENSYPIGCHAAKKIFQICPEVKQKLWGGAFWTAGYYVYTVSRHGNEFTISNYVKNQGKSDYEVIHKSDQLELFE